MAASAEGAVTMPSGDPANTYAANLAWFRERVAGLRDRYPLLDDQRRQRNALRLVDPPLPLIEPGPDADVWERFCHACEVHEDALARRRTHIGALRSVDALDD